MPLKGTLSVFSTTQLLNLINLAKKSGTLRIYEGVATGEMLTLGDGETRIPRLEAGEQRAEVHFREGKLLYASMRDKSGDLTSVLQKAGRLNDDQARVIRERARNHNDKALALMLINANYVTKQHIVQSIQKHTVDIVFDLMVWDKEPFEFEEGAPTPQDRIIVPIPLENVIIEFLRRAHDEQKLIEELPNLDFALKFREAPEEKFKEIQLSTAEWRVVGFVNPKNSIRQIAKACNMTEMEIRRVVHALREAGLVELVKPPSARPPKPTAPGIGGKKPDGAPSSATVKRIINRIKQI
jgi:transposase